MKVLMSAFACEPGKGSEPEVGWRWATEMGRSHQVVVLTRSNNRPVIEGYLKDNPTMAEGVEFIYFDLSRWALWLKKKMPLFNWYYVLWQFRARKLIAKEVGRRGIDLVHLVTFASFRYPVFLGRSRVPVVWGPVGGAEMAPWDMLFHVKRWSMVKEIVRNLATTISKRFLSLVDPTIRTGGVALASTPATMDALESRGIHARLMPTIGLDVYEEPTRSEQKGVLTYLFVGRLVLLKGVNFLIEAFAKADTKASRLIIAGDGPERGKLEELVEQFDLGERVKFLGMVRKGDLNGLYDRCDVLVAPSLYESGGYMVLEGFSRKIPAIVTNVGGLSMSVDEGCGFKVDVGSVAEVIEGLRLALEAYSENPSLALKHGEGGFKNLKESYLWEQKRNIMNGIYQEAITSI